MSLVHVVHHVLLYFDGILKMLHEFVGFIVTKVFLGDQPLCTDMAGLP
jgi:hypothetical protein